ncbi:MAG: hypothetical protein KDJ35_04850 [Alphaproteobacteria bacterium]|nr:hypothetical protein [Alphaproteobacteria bacterium]
MIITFLFCVFCTGIVFVLSAHDAYALRVSLKRVVFEGPKRSEILTIINNTGEEQTYRLGWRKYKMDEYKSLKAVDENGDDSGVLWADDMVRFAPRRVTIPAGGSQQIRLLLRRPSDLQTAEYRSHLWIVTETKPEKFDIQTDSKDGQAIKLAVQPAISLPVFVRNGALQASASISDAKLTRTGGGLKASFVLNREGNESIYGDFDFICTDSGQNKVLKQVRGISVYPEISKRYLDFDIGLGPETATSCNSVNILYRADPDDPEFKGKTLAQSTVTLSN